MAGGAEPTRIWSQESFPQGSVLAWEAQSAGLDLYKEEEGQLLSAGEGPTTQGAAGSARRTEADRRSRDTDSRLGPGAAVRGRPAGTTPG